MPEKLERCVSQVSAQLRKKHPDWSADKVKSAAYGICVEQTGLKPNSEALNSMSERDNKNSGVKLYNEFVDIPFHYTVGIKVKESSVKPESPEVIFSGTAINETTTKNHNIYEADELRVSAHTLKGCPFLMDHVKSALTTIGRVKESEYNEAGRRVDFEVGMAKNDPIAQRVANGYITNVSVGGRVKEMRCNICNELMSHKHEHKIGEIYEGVECGNKLRGIIFEELTLTPDPADVGSSIGIAASMSESVSQTIQENFKLFEESSRSNDSIKNTSMETKTLGMSEEDIKNLIKENERLKLEKEKLSESVSTNEAQLKELSRIKEEAKLLKEREHQRKVQETLSFELKLGRTTKENAKSREQELTAMESMRLEVRHELLADEVKKMEEAEKQKPKPRSVVTETRGTESNIHHQIDEKLLEKEAKTRRLQEMIFGDNKTSKSGIKDMKDYDNKTGRWKTFV